MITELKKKMSHTHLCKLESQESQWCDIIRSQRPKSEGSQFVSSTSNLQSRRCCCLKKR